jgi:hypothetical protein
MFYARAAAFMKLGRFTGNGHKRARALFPGHHAHGAFGIHGRFD